MKYMNITYIINKTEVKDYFFSDIYIDDTIGNIKYKLRNYLGISELYLFISIPFVYDAEYYQNKGGKYLIRNTVEKNNGNSLLDYYENLSNYLIEIPLGIENKNIMFQNVTNPFKLLATDNLKKEEIINDDTLLMNFDGKCKRIMVCDKENVMKYLEEINQENYIERYFPNYLKKKDYRNENEIVNKCYELEPVPLSDIKLTKIKFEIKSKRTLNLVLSDLFRNIHLNELYTYSYLSKLYKLYSLGKNTNNEKVPLMKSNKINICHKLVKNPDDFCIYINIKKNFIFFEINKVGDIWIHYESEEGNDLIKIESILKKYINGLIDEINNIIFSGVCNGVGIFESLYSDRVKIIDINCNLLLKTNDIFINKMIFYLKNNKKANEYELIFKRVSDYNIAYEIQDYLLKNRANNIIKEYSLTLEEANEYANMNVIKKEKNDVILMITKMLGYCNISIINLDNIYYINTLQYYLKSLTQNIESFIELPEEEEEEEEEKEELYENEEEELSSSSSSSSSDENEEEESSSEDEYMPYGHLLKKGGRKISYFQKRIELRDAELLNNKMNFSKKCALDIKRQPISLTKDEYEMSKDKIDDALEFRNNYYICPRYWSFKYGRVITEEEFKSGKFGELIEKIPENVEGLNYVYEFATKSGYKKQYPGFIEDHGKGICMPCCFGKIQDELKIEKMKRQCVGRKRIKKVLEIKDAPTHISNEKVIKQGNWGFLPKILQAYLGMVNKTDKIKMNVSYLLRYGVEESKNQSFIACMSTILYYKTWNSKIPSIKEMKNIIINGLTIDRFTSYQNSNLVSQFYDKTKKVEINEKYKDSKIYKLFPESYFIKVVNSFENFIQFLKSDDVVIDHTYLWDLFSFPDPNLFNKGINIIIFEVIENKSGMDRVNLLCPTNHELNKLYDENKESIILIKHKLSSCVENKYEPVFIYKKMGNGNIYIRSLFVVSLLHGEKDITDNILTNIVKPIFNYKCKPIKVNEQYKYKIPNNIEDIMDKIKEKKYFELNNYVINNDGKLVGVLISDNMNGIIGYVPCNPTNVPLDSDKIINIENIAWNNYSDTKLFLENWYKSGNFYKVVEAGIVIGFLTKTNEFIEIYPYIKDPGDYKKDIELGYNPNLMNQYIIDKIGSLDEDRVIQVNKIKLESQLYKTFKTRLRTYIMNFYNYKIKNAINLLVDNKELPFEEKINKIVEILKPIMKDKIIFVDEYEQDCLINEKNNCNKSDKKLIIPKQNMIDPEEDNSNNYYIKLADEIVRYRKITGNWLDEKYQQNNDYLSEFIINNDEILLNIGDRYDIEDNIIDINPFVKNTTFDTVNPEIKRNMTNEQEFMLNKKNDLCFIVEKLNEPFSLIFPKNTQRHIYYSSVMCTYKFIMKITGLKNVEEIKEILIEKFSEKKNIFDKLQKLSGRDIKNYSETIIYNENYHISIIDLWILISHFKIPSFLFSKQKILDTNLKTRILYKEPDSEYFLFIYVNQNEIIPEYSYITKGDNMFFKLDELDVSNKNIYTIEIKNKIKSYSFDEFIMTDDLFE